MGENNMNKLKKILTSATVVAMLSTPAISGEGFEGLSIGITASTNTFGLAGQEQITRMGEEVLEKYSKDKDIDVAEIFVEYTGPGGSSIGIEWIPGNHNFGSESRALKTVTTVDDNVVHTADGEITNHMTFYAEPTYMFGNAAGIQFGAFGTVGIHRFGLNTIESLPNSQYGDRNVWGGMYGAGFKGVHASGLFFKVKATHSQYLKFDMTSTGSDGTTKINGVDISNNAVKLALGYNF